MPDSSTAGPVPLTLTGIEQHPALPDALGGAARSANGQVNPFLPPGYLEPILTYDVGPSARSAVAGETARHFEAADDQVIMLELDDNSAFFTSAVRLREALLLAHPDMLDGDTILLEKLRAASAVPGRGLGKVVKGLITKVFLFRAGRAPDAITDDALRLGQQAPPGISWLGTKALMRAIENRLEPGPGLYRWHAGGKHGALTPFAPDDLVQAVARKAPILVFVHGTGSNTFASFGDLHADQQLWTALTDRFGQHIYGLEHRTLSESPIENALALVRALPKGAHVSLVSHSRGGMICDLLCLGDFDGHIEQYKYRLKGTGTADPREATRIIEQLEGAHAHQREQLKTLANALRERQIVVQRYVRTAAPANGTLLASGNFDVFLSGLLNLIRLVAPLPMLYQAFTRVVIEVAKNRTDAHLVPGIEAMLPDSPMARLLAEAPVRAGGDMALIAGDIEGGNMLARLGVLLTDFLLFDKEDHDLVVNTQSMLAGIAPRVQARVLFDRAADVSHFNYFRNQGTRIAMRDWLVEDKPADLASFHELPSEREYASALAKAKRGARSAAGSAPNRPLVVIVPGVMGSSLLAAGGDKVWFDAPDLLLGGLKKIAWGQRDVAAGEISASLYGKLAGYLAENHRVELFAYDWRSPLDVLGDRLGEFLARLQASAGANAPIRLLAHSMGGLVVRACIHNPKRQAMMNALMERPGSRLIMLGTPNHGAHSMVENLLGKGDALRSLARLDLEHDMQSVLDVIAEFRGVLQLLPRSGFVDTFQGQEGGGALYDFQQASTWVDLNKKITDFWFGDGCSGKPAQAALNEGGWLWQAPHALPAEYKGKSVYVFGQAPNTACGVREVADGRGTRLKMVGTSLGDGTVTWDSGRLEGIGSYFYMPVRHGDLPATEQFFPALAELLATGASSKLSKTAPAARGGAPDTPVSYDAGPPAASEPEALQRALLGGSPGDVVPVGTQHRLDVTVKAMDLRFLARPVMVGHYEQDPISGAEALIDSELLDGDLSMRYSLGPYAGPRGTATVVLQAHGKRGLSGAVVTGLGRLDESALSPTDLTECVCAGALRYLLQVVDVLGKQDREVRLASLLIGYNSSASLTVANSVEALVRGVMEANARFLASTRLNIHIGRLDIVELYVDTAITAVYALRDLGARLASEARKRKVTLTLNSELVTGEGMRQRLFDNGQSNYWPRLLVTTATPDGGSGAGAVVADRLRYLYVSERARAESIVQQRQPGLVESLVKKQIGASTWEPDFARMLFQLMIPHDFKGPARQLDRLVLVLDAVTANLPWELMMADQPGGSVNGSTQGSEGVPLALQAAVVRQLSSSTYRTHVRGAMRPTALVIGNPSLEGFNAAFSHFKEKLKALPGAEREARAVKTLLDGLDYQVDACIGHATEAEQVLAALYRQPWRVVHIAAHGIFEERHADGRKRSGVVLSGGLLITAAEIGAMEVVPELVFFNCCHLGQIDAGRNANKLAASVARELIEIGGRCVIVSGWAIEDNAALVFAQAFYQQLLERRLAFGDAVFEARKTTFSEHGKDLTWGAFQAYGDPGWMAGPRAPDSTAQRATGQLASIEELLDTLAHTRVAQSHRRGALGKGDARARAEAVSDMVRTRCPPAWLAMPQLHSALAATYFELDQLATARDEYLAAIKATNHIGVIPIHDIERLANVEVLLGEGRANGSGGQTGGPPAAGDASMLDLALKRLNGLEALLADPGAAADSPSVADDGASAVRSALRANAWKGKASLHARRLLSSTLDDAEALNTRTALDDALKTAVKVYAQAESIPDNREFEPMLALKRLALENLAEQQRDAQDGAQTDAPDGTQSGAQNGHAVGRDEAVARVRQYRQRAHDREREFSQRLAIWSLVIEPEAMLVEHLIRGSLGTKDETARMAEVEIERAYAEATSNIALKRSEVEAIAADITLLSQFYDVAAKTTDKGATMARTAERLAHLGKRVQTGGAQQVH